ncbi:MAG: hypothetical protein ABH877_02730 [bacterium]
MVARPGRVWLKDDAGGDIVVFLDADQVRDLVDGGRRRVLELLTIRAKRLIRRSR